MRDIFSEIFGIVPGLSHRHQLKGIKLWSDFHGLISISFFKICLRLKAADTNENTLGKRILEGRTKSYIFHPAHLTPDQTHNFSVSPLTRTLPQGNKHPWGSLGAGKTLTKSHCLLSHWKYCPTLIPKPDPHKGWTQLGPTATDCAPGGSTSVTCPGLWEPCQEKPGMENCGA